MKVNSYNIEFGYELLSAIPYAKWLQENGQLTETESAFDTAPLYYFSPKHKENKGQRLWGNMLKAKELPNIGIHTYNFDFSKFANPGYKEHFKNDEFVYDKPIVCICNRYNVEWGEKAYNYFNVDVLADMFEKLKDKFQIIYFAVDIPAEFYDGVTPLELADRLLIQNRFPEVIIFQDLIKKSWNETILKVFANCEYFITMNGGYSILSAMFGGKNIIYSKKCRELQVKSFKRWYPKFAGQRTHVVNNYGQLLEAIDNHFIKEIPCVNILIRTCNRPNYFADCMQSIEMQTYKNINVIVSTDDRISNEYTYKHDLIHVPLTRIPRESKEHYPYNLYFNEMYKYCYDGYILHLDDDDKLLTNDACEKIVNADANLLMWRVQFPGRLIPENVGSEPKCRDISGIGFAVRKGLEKNWKDEKCGDYEVISRLVQDVEPMWITDVLTGIQERVGNAGRKDKQIKITMIDKPVLIEYTNCEVNRRRNLVTVHKEMPILMAKELEKKGIVKIINLDNMEKVRILKRCFASGRLHETGDIVEVSFNKAKSLILQGYAEQYIEQTASVAQEQVEEPIIETDQAERVEEVEQIAPQQIEKAPKKKGRKSKAK